MLSWEGHGGAHIFDRDRDLVKIVECSTKSSQERFTYEIITSCFKRGFFMETERGEASEKKETVWFSQKAGTRRDRRTYQVAINWQIREAADWGGHLREGEFRHRRVRDAIYLVLVRSTPSSCRTSSSEKCK